MPNLFGERLFIFVIIKPHCMKRYLLLFAFASIVSLGNSQIIQPLDEAFEVAGEPVYINGSMSVGTDYELTTHFHIQNNSGQQLEIGVRRFLVDVVEGSTNKFCWAGLCYGLEDNFSANTIMMAPDQIFNSENPEEQFKGYYYHNDVAAGCSTIDYRFTDVNDLTLSTVVRVIYGIDSDCTVGVSELTKPEAKLTEASPNPASEATALSYDFGYNPSNGKVAVYNMMGRLVKEISVRGKVGSLFLGVEDLAEGIYLYTLNDGNQVLATRKLVVSK